jgi:hypothetical protein
LESDASQYGAGSVLSQERQGIIKPVAYYSRSLSKPEKNYSTIERELLSIVISVEHFRQFLYGKRFKIVTDHKPLIYCFNSKDPAPRIARWLLRLNNYEFDIEYRSGTSNGNADALSRLMDDSCESEQEHYEDIMINHLFGDDHIDDNNDDEGEVSTNNVPIEQLNSNQARDQDLVWLFNLKQKAIKDNKYIIEIDTNKLSTNKNSLYRQWHRILILDKALYRKWVKHKQGNRCILQYIIPNHQRKEILLKAHDIKTSGHLGINKTCEKIKDRYYWPQWEKQVRDYILSCETCQKIKAPAVSRNAPLQPILPSKPMEIVTTDCMGPVPTSNNRNKHALIIIDHFTKWVEIHAIRDTQAKTVAKCLVKFICRHGIPDQLHSDQGTSYRNELLDHITELLDIHKTQTAAYHPQCDGISERFMRPLKAMISSYIDEHQKDWDHNLDQFAFAYNTSTHASTQYSPFFLMYGREPKIPLDFVDQATQIDFGFDDEEYATQLQQRLESAFNIVKTNRDHKIDQAKIRHDRTVRAAKFKINDQVWLQVKFVKKGISRKLAARWDGPYQVIATIGETSYRIKPIKKYGRAITVHRDRLKKHFVRSIEFEDNSPPSTNNETTAASQITTQHELSKEQERPDQEPLELDSNHQPLIQTVTEQVHKSPNDQIKENRSIPQLLIINRPKRITNRPKKYPR